LVSSSQQDRTFFRDRGFGKRIGFGSRPALIVIDLIKAFTDPERPLGSDLDDVVGATCDLLTAARAVPIPILFTSTWYHPDLTDAGIWRLKQPMLDDLRVDGDGHELDARLGQREGETLVIKKYASGFFGTDLASRLTSGGVDTLLLVGATTSGCVRATAVDAVQSGFRPMVVAEAVGDRSQAAHDQSLFDLEQKYADVVTLQESLVYLTTLPSLIRAEP
jgi:nicotinamidase-related amidase